MSLNLGNIGWSQELAWADPGDEPTAGTGKTSQRPNRVVLPTADGRTIILIADHNSADAANGYGDKSGNPRIKVFEVNAAFGVSTLRAQVNIGPMWQPYERFSADMYADGSIGLVYQRKDNNNICYRKISAAWSVGTEEVVVAALPNVILGLDLSISEADVPAVSAAIKADSNPTLRLRAWVRATTGGVWTSMTAQTIIDNGTPINAYTNTSLTFVRGGTSGARPIMFAVDSAQNNNDRGTRIYTAVVNESTGAIVNFQLRKTYLAGNMATTFNSLTRRTYLFPSGTGEVVIAHMEGVDKKNVMIARHTFDGNAWAEPMPAQTTVLGVNPFHSAKFAASFAKDRVNFYYIQTVGGSDVAVNLIGIIDRPTNTVRWSGPFRWDNGEANPDRYFPMAGTGRYAYSTDFHPMVYFNSENNLKFQARAHRNMVPPVPFEVKPAGGSLLTGTPELSLKVRLGLNFPQSKHKAVWQLATDSNFTTNLKTYTQADDKFVRIENTAAQGSFYFISDVLPAAMAISSGTWHVRAAVIDEFGVQGPWSAAGSVDLSHPPAAANLSPNGVLLGNAVVQFKWDFTDPLSTDHQTAYQLIVERVDTGAVVLDTGKVTTISTSTIRDLGADLLGVDFRWKVRLWDVDDTPGEYSAYATFGIAGAPTVAVNQPAPNAALASGTPQILFTPAADGGRRVRAYVVNIMSDGTVVRSSGYVSVDVPGGEQIAWRSPRPLLEKNTQYYVQVSVVDELGLTGNSDVIPFTVNWVSPAGPTGIDVDTSHFNVEDEGYVEVTWTGAQDAQFAAWIIERRDDLIDAAHVVTQEGEWQEIDEVTTSEMIYRDYFAPSGLRSVYRVRQLVNRGGDLAISELELTKESFPDSDGYWIVEPTTDSGDPSAFRLSTVTADDFTDEWEESEYVVIGRGRHVDRGDYLGVVGTLTAQLRDTPFSTARAKRLRLKRARDNETMLYLRNPFGDVYHVNVGNIQVSRIAGVGKMEFVDVQVPYSEVDAGSD